MENTQTAAMHKQIENHGKDLLKIYPTATEKDPVKLCKKLHRIERAAHQYAEDCCNGVNVPATEAEQEKKAQGFRGKAQKVLGNGPAVMLNLDPRGYALKIKSATVQAEKLTIYRDMGGYGIICPEFDGTC